MTQSYDHMTQSCGHMTQSYDHMTQSCDHMTYHHHGDRVVDVVAVEACGIVCPLERGSSHSHHTVHHLVSVRDLLVLLPSPHPYCLHLHLLPEYRSIYHSSCKLLLKASTSEHMPLPLLLFPLLQLTFMLSTKTSFPSWSLVRTMNSAATPTWMGSEGTSSSEASGSTARSG